MTDTLPAYDASVGELCSPSGIYPRLDRRCRSYYPHTDMCTNLPNQIKKYEHNESSGMYKVPYPPPSVWGGISGLGRRVSCGEEY